MGTGTRIPTTVVLFTCSLVCTVIPEVGHGAPGIVRVVVLSENGVETEGVEADGSMTDGVGMIAPSVFGTLGYMVVDAIVVVTTMTWPEDTTGTTGEGAPALMLLLMLTIALGMLEGPTSEEKNTCASAVEVAARSRAKDLSATIFAFVVNVKKLS